MNTTDLIIQLSEQLCISRAEARRLLQQELSAISQQLSEGKNVIIRGFGTLGLRNLRASKKNPHPGQTVFFRASQKLKALVRPWRP
ncbi:MAG: HU family DNA-binding protein [Gammaproteobacteria bacterium]|nr:HU family DNA-binding protein [Gammaproteobacteria bacterium]